MRLSKRNKALVAVMLLASLSACADYLNRRDSVSFGAGDAAEGNTAIHSINPFPPAASNTTIVVDG